ncbi:MAG: hypothetical protein QOJ03_1466 [Frankiaceae bacterium]|jgi:RNA polymerase sigma-70 factor (ECF subfamily)|nr:hypothetical protein [Frankiaceae bacterium]
MDVSPAVERSSDDRSASPDSTTVTVPETYLEFYQREWRPAVALAYALCADRAIAEEVAQESLIVAFDKWATISAYDVPGAWLRRVVARKATSVVRRRVAEAKALTRWGQRERPSTMPMPAEDHEVWGIVAKLPRRQAQVIALHYLEDLDAKRIATILDCGEATVRVHLHRGRRTLAQQLGGLDVGEGET